MPAWLGLVPSSLGREVGTRQTLRRGACLLASVRRCVNERSLGRLSRYISMQVDIDRNGGKLRTGLHRRWGSFVASSGGRGRAKGARHPRPPARHNVIGQPNADILHHGPPPAYAHG